MYPLLIVLIVLAAILMCFIVLIQNSKGGGLAAGFASSNQIMGVRKTTDFIEKFTWGLAVAMVVLSVASAYFIPKQEAEQSVIMNEATRDRAVNPLNAPAGFETPISIDESAAPATEAQPTEAQPTEAQPIAKPEVEE